MAFTPAKPAPKFQASTTGIRVSVRYHERLNKTKVRVSMNVPAQIEWFGAALTPTDKLTVMYGDRAGSDNGKLLIRKDTIGEHRATAGPQGSITVVTDGFHGVPATDVASTPAPLATGGERKPNEVIIWLPWSPTGRRVLERDGIETPA